MAHIKASEFNEDHLKQGGVWAWSSDLHDSEDVLVEVPLTEESLSNLDSLLIRANITTANGDLLHGLVIYSMGRAEVFAIEILDGEQKFTLNRFAPDLSRGELTRLAAHLSKDGEELLPMKYEITVEQLDIPSGLFGF